MTQPDCSSAVAWYAAVDRLLGTAATAAAAGQGGRFIDACEQLRAVCGDPPVRAMTQAEALLLRADTWMDAWPQLAHDAAFRRAVAQEARIQARQIRSSAGSDL